MNESRGEDETYFVDPISEKKEKVIIPPPPH